MDIWRDLAGSYNSVGSALQDSGNTVAALEQFRKALPIYEELLTANPEDRSLRRSLSVSYQSIGRALFLNNDTNRALENNQKALALREALLADDPRNADYRRILSVSYQDDGDYRAWIRDIQGALESFRKKLSIDEQAVAADPVNAQATGDLAYCSLRLGELLATSGEHAQALGFFSRAAEAYEKGVAIDARDEGIPMRAASARARLARAQAELSNIALAHEQSDKASKLLFNSTDDPGNSMARRTRAIAFGDLAEAYATLAAKGQTSDTVAKDWRAARDMYQRSLTALDDLKDRGILDAEELPELDKTRQRIAECETALSK